MLEQSSTFITSTAIEHSSINRIAMLHVIKLLAYKGLYIYCISRKYDRELNLMVGNVLTNLLYQLLEF